jgi:hypothetical protein
MKLEESTKKDKRLMATFSNGRIIHFGLKGGSTYIDHKDKTKRENYIARHKVREDFNNPQTAGALSRWILWGDYTDLEKNRKEFVKRFQSDI